MASVWSLFSEQESPPQINNWVNKKVFHVKLFEVNKNGITICKLGKINLTL